MTALLIPLDPLPSDPLGIPDADEDSMEFINVPGAGSRGNPKLVQNDVVKNARDVSEWVDTMVLTTLQRVLHISDTLGRERWHLSKPFIPQSGAVLESIPTVISPHAGQSERRPHVQFLTFAPWEVTSGDMESFSQVRTHER